MKVEHGPIVEASLDPADWDALRALGHRMVDEMIAYLESVRERPVWQPIPDRVQAALRAPLPLEPAGAEPVYEDFRRDRAALSARQHPSALLGLGDRHRHAARRAERDARGDHEPQRRRRRAGAPTTSSSRCSTGARRCSAIPRGASGLLVSGGSMANLVGLAVARDAKAEVDVVAGRARSARRGAWCSTPRARRTTRCRSRPRCSASDATPCV